MTRPKRVACRQAKKAVAPRRRKPSRVNFKPFAKRSSTSTATSTPWSAICSTPVSSQVSVFVSLDAGQQFVPDSIALKVNDRLVASHLYTEREVTALQRGGIQRLFTGNVRKGDHEMIAVLTGTGPKGKPYRRAVSVVFDKEAGAKYLELKIQGSRERQEPLFEFSEWE